MARRKDHLTFTVDLPGGALRRLEEAILYVASVCESDDAFGLTRLNKTLFEADFLSFALHGRPITGVRYQRIQNGPAPKAMLPRLQVLEARGDLKVRQRDHLGRLQKKPIALREPDLSIFSGEDIAILDDIIRGSWGKLATVVSDESHRIQWWTRLNGDDIPYEAAWLSNAPVSEVEAERTMELARELGW